MMNCLVPSYIGQSRLDKGSGTERVMDPGHNLSQDGLKPGSQCLIDSCKVLGILLHIFLQELREKNTNERSVKHHFT